jgi:arginyl-tRNA synthetase
MIKPEQWLSDALGKTIIGLYGNTGSNPLVIQPTRKDVEGDFTLVCFGLTKLSGKTPAQTAQEIGEAFCMENPEAGSYNIANGFLNINLTFKFWITYLNGYTADATEPDLNKAPVMIEYSSPNTNKPLHLGHVRNNLLGAAVANIIEASGRKVIKVNLVNDRGIHICKSMIAWQKSGLNETPESSGIKGDHLIGKYYVEFDRALKIQSEPILSKILAGDFIDLDEKSTLKATAIVEKYNQSTAEKQEELKGELKLLANSGTALMKEAAEMLRQWEAGDEATIQLWKTMNGWVYQGFDVTYKRLGVSFDKIYYESQTYLLGKELVDSGLNSGVLYKKEDGSVWIDLTAEGLDHKLLLRSDGTSVYMTQDLGTALLRAEEYHAGNYVYVVGNEQDYHFKVLQLILRKLGYAWADGIYHLSYGMVDLPTGKMKSREGTVVDADDLIDEVILEAKKKSEELGKTETSNSDELTKLYERIGMAALKYFILKVDPKKRMVFNPAESIDINGNTGPFIQYSFARIQSVIRKAHGVLDESYNPLSIENEAAHRTLIRTLEQFHETVQASADSYNPSLVANYAYELAKQFNHFYHEFSILKEENKDLASFRLELARKTGQTLEKAMGLLGIEMPERM